MSSEKRCSRFFTLIQVSDRPPRHILDFVDPTGAQGAVICQLPNGRKHESTAPSDWAHARPCPAIREAVCVTRHKKTATTNALSKKAAGTTTSGLPELKSVRASSEPFLFRVFLDSGTSRLFHPVLVVVREPLDTLSPQP